MQTGKESSTDKVSSAYLLFQEQWGPPKTVEYGPVWSEETLWMGGIFSWFHEF